MLQIRRLSSRQEQFWGVLEGLTAWQGIEDPRVTRVVAEIIDAVRQRGDVALLEYTRRFDGLDVAAPEELEIPHQRLREALESLPSAARGALEAAAARIVSYHERQRGESWSYTDADGTLLGQQVTPLERVGLYVPGGKAAYPSSVLMNAIPARVAGVPELTMAVPAPRGEVNDLVLAAAAVANVSRVYTIGGAQAVAALAFGTATIAAVDKIVGPGNVYVAAAKRQVFGTVGIDMIAGPSEILIVCDGQTDPDWIALDLFSQAEHDEQAQSILVSPDVAFLDRVAVRLQSLLPGMARRRIIERSLADRCALIRVRDLAEAVEIVNFVAPEHLELSVEDPAALLPAIRHAGAIFMGRYTPEALGDYCAGPNHVLPTAGTARFSSPLGVYDFQKRSSLIQCTASGAGRLAATAAVLARGEGLEAHARSAECRVPGNEGRGARDA